MQLSLIDYVPEFSKNHFLDVFAEAILEPNQKRMRLETIDGQGVPAQLKISVPRKFISQYPEGTIYKVDTKLVRKDGQKPYFVAVDRKLINRALEYFEYNLKVQNGFDYVPPSKKRK
jgi:hypothetical protein